MSKEEKSFESKVLNTPFEREDAYHSLSMPLYNSVAYEFDTAEAMQAAFCGQSPDHTYSRITNPTVQYFESRVRAITGAADVVAFNSGMAAISNVIIALGRSGANIVTSSHLFGNTYSLFNSTLRDFGIEARFCDLTDLRDVEANIDENTCAVFFETITNPQQEVADIAALSAIACRTGVPLVADTTMVPFNVFSARDFGIDIEIVSSTKYISGGATSLGGLVIDHGTFDWTLSPKLSALAGQFGDRAFTVKMRKEVHRNLGAYMTPQAAYMQTLGIETMNIRFERQAGTCLELARRLSTLSAIESVNYTGLEGNAYYDLSRRQFGRLPGAMFTFDMPSREACFALINRLKLIRRATNLFDNKTLAIHPASTIFGTFTEEQRESMDISQKTIRISVGLESVDDLYEDIFSTL